MSAASLSLEPFAPFPKLDGWDGRLRQRLIFFRSAARRFFRDRVWLSVVCSALTGVALIGTADSPEWPAPLSQGAAAPLSDDEALIRAQRVCVLNTRDSAGDIGRSLVVRHRRDGDRLWVSYFVYWSSERPWGHKPWWLSLAIDAVYSHFLFVLPGLRHALYGPGDIEGVTVVYRALSDRLEIVEGFGDDEYHRKVHLGPNDLTGSDNHTVLMTTSWSHQLGGRGGARVDERAAVSRRCFEGSEIVPLTSDIASRFSLGSASSPRRARQAWL